MQAVTIRQAGADGVMEAIADGMKAGEYARRLKAATAENDSLKNTVAEKEAEINRLQKENRWHRFVRSHAYADALEAQVAETATRKERLLTNGVLFLAGMVAGLAVAFTIIWCFGG